MVEVRELPVWQRISACGSPLAWNRRAPSVTFEAVLTGVTEMCPCKVYGISRGAAQATLPGMCIYMGWIGAHTREGGVVVEDTCVADAFIERETMLRKIVDAVDCTAHEGVEANMAEIDGERGGRTIVDMVSERGWTGATSRMGLRAVQHTLDVFKKAARLFCEVDEVWVMAEGAAYGTVVRREIEPL